MSLALFDFSTTSQSVNESLLASNAVLQSAQSTCSVTCSNESSGNTYVFDGTTAGNLDFSQTCAITGTECLISSYLETNITDIMSSMAKQTEATMNPIGMSAGNFSSHDESVDITESVYNSMTQLISNNCAITATNKSTNNYYYYKDATIGNISFAQNASVGNAECVMDTVAKATAKTDQSASSDQSTGCTGYSGSGNSNLIIIVVVVIGVLFFVIIIVAVFIKTKAPATNQWPPNSAGVLGVPNIEPASSSSSDMSFAQMAQYAAFL